MSVPPWLAGRRLVPADLTAEGNAFTALRWLLASTVMFSHGWDLTQWRTGLDPSVALLGFPVAGLAVFLFFTLSGFLVTGSLVKRGPVAFGVARALRLIPGLWVMLILVTLGLGAWVSTLPFADYLRDPRTWRYVVDNALLLNADYRLPGIFENLPVRGVNGSLWTIPQEVRCYVVLGILGALGALRSRRWLLAAFLIAVAVHIAIPLDAIPALDRPRRLALSFFLGVIAYQWRGEIRWSWPAALAGVAAALALVRAPLPPAVSMVALQVAFAYLIGVAAFVAPAGIKRLSRALPDYSYGIYIYAFPAQQLAVELGWGRTPLANIGVGFALLLPFAAASWHLIEKPALTLKSRTVLARRQGVSEDFTLGTQGQNGHRRKSTS